MLKFSFSSKSKLGPQFFSEGFGIWKVKITLTSYAWLPTSPPIAHGHKCPILGTNLMIEGYNVARGDNN
jgi:hypothetical protein